MKCPYRTKVTFIEPEPKTLSTSEGKVTITKVETADFEDCYEEDCPFYNSYADSCGRVIQETGGEL